MIFEPCASWCEEFLEACGNLSGLGETCQPAVSKHYRKEMQGDCGLKLQHFRDPIETRWVNLSKFGPWPPGAEAAAVSQPLQQA